MFPFENLLQIVGSKLTLFPILGFVIFYCIIIAYMAKGELTINIKFEDKIALLFFFYIVVITFIRGNIFNEFTVLRTYFLLVCFFILVKSYVRSEKDFNIVGWIIIISLSFSDLFVLLNSVGILNLDITKVYSQGVLRYGGFLADPNSFALYNIIGLIYCYFYTQKYKKSSLKTVFVSLMFFVIFISFVLTVSLEGLIVLFTIFVLVFFQDLLLVRRQQSSTIIFLFFVIVFSIVFSSNKFKQRLVSKYMQIKYEPFVYWGSTRGACWYASFELIKSNPLLGVGEETLPKAILDFYPLSTSYIEKKDTHNMYLYIWGGEGIVGLIIYLIFFIGGIFKLKRVSKLTYLKIEIERKCIYYSIITFLLFGFFLSCHRKKYLWLFLALSYSFDRLFQKSGNKIKKRS